MTLVLTLREPPEQRLDLSSLVPDLLAGKSAAEIEKIELQTTRVRLTVGDVIGDAGIRAGRLMTGGRLTIRGRDLLP